MRDLRHHEVGDVEEAGDAVPRDVRRYAAVHPPATIACGSLVRVIQYIVPLGGGGFFVLSE